MLQKLLYKIQDFFGISPKESRGALVLIVISFMLIWAPTVVKWWVLPLFQDDKIPFTIEYLDSTAALIPEQVPSPGTQTYDNEANREERTIRLFKFDPNTATTDQLQDLGIPRFLAQRIQKYREKGGKFRRKEDLQKIYDFPPTLFGRLAPYITLSGEGSFSERTGDNNVGNLSSETKTLPLPKEIKAYGRAVPVPFDINTTDTAQLATLKGIGSTFSLRIVKFRDALGGFHSVDQYSEIYGLDSVALTELRRYGRIQSPPQKIAINTASTDDLYKHPYLRNRKLNDLIVRYREQHGPYTSPESLKGIRIMDETLLRKITPYLSF